MQKARWHHFRRLDFRNTMKNKMIRLATLLFCARLFLVAPAAQAQNPMGGAFLDRLKGLFAELKVTEDQQEKLREAFMSEIEKLMPLMADQSLSREDKMRKFQEWSDQMDVKIKPILTPEQFDKYRQKKEEWQKAGGRGPRQDPTERIRTALKCTDEEWTVLKPLVEDVSKAIRERLNLTGTREVQNLQKAIADANTPVPDIQNLMEAVRANLREKEAALKASRDRLRQVLTARQEAALLSYGILD